MFNNINNFNESLSAHSALINPTVVQVLTIEKEELATSVKIKSKK